MLLACCLAGPLLAAATPARRTLWVDQASTGGRCDDGRTAAEVAAAEPPGSKPWCTLGAAGRQVRAGDEVIVRGGAYTTPMTCGTDPGCSGMCVLELVKKGTADAPIAYRAARGETPVITPGGAVPRRDVPHGLVYGVCAGVTAPVGLCRAGARRGRDCTTDDTAATTGCPGADCPGCCDRRPTFHTVIDGFTFRDWDHVDTDPKASNARHTPSQYAVMLMPGVGVPADVTIRNGELTDNEGGGVLHARTTARVAFEHNHVHHNHTRGWTSAVNFWRSAGAVRGPNVIRGNVIHDNEDDPAVWCLPKYCAGPRSQRAPCVFDSHTNTRVAQPQGWGCACARDADCASGRCVERACGPETGGCECAGDTEGHGVILDVSNGTCAPGDAPETMCTWAEDPACAAACTAPGRPHACCTGPRAGRCCTPGAAGAFVVERNVIFANEGNCISVFKAAGAVVRHNTCWRNQRRPGGGEITAFTNDSAIEHNVLVPRDGRYALALFSESPLFAIDPRTIREGDNLMWSPSSRQLVHWGGGERGTVEEFVAANRVHGWGRGDVQQDPMLAPPPALRPRPGSPLLGAGARGHLASRD